METAPSQDFFILTLLHIDERKAELSTLDGNTVEVLLAFGTRISGRANSAEPYRRTYPGDRLTVKALGIAARRELGLRPRTLLHMTTRILWQNTVLPMHRPVATFLSKHTKAYQKACNECHFCRDTLRKGRENEEDGPFPSCFFCKDSPAWHHGACCPHNPLSRYYHGRTHKERFEDLVRAERNF